MKYGSVKRKIRTALISLFLVMSCSSVFALEEYVIGIYKEIDQIFVKKSDKELDTVLKKNQGDKYYYLIENYTEKKIRRLIVNDEYDFAMAAVVVVIENNLDNEQAVEMYSSISDAYEVQKKFEEDAEKKRQQELARIEKEKEKKRENVNKNYVAKTTSEGTSVYVSGKEVKSSSTRWKGSFGLVNFANVYEQEFGVNTINYGIVANYTHEYSTEKYIIGGDGGLDFKFLNLNDSKTKIPLMLDLELMPKIAFPNVFKNFYVRGGFVSTAIGKGGNQKEGNLDALVQKFYTPAVGIQLENLKMGKTNLTMNYDYYAGHILYDNITSAMGAGLNLEIPFASVEQVKVTLNLGVRDKIFIKENGIENRANVVFAIGAENVNK